jgi:hypothetical protein
MTIKYLEAQEREGNNFDFDRWLQQVRAEDARKRGETVVAPTSTNMQGRKPVIAHGGGSVAGRLSAIRVLRLRGRAAKNEARIDEPRGGREILHDKIIRVSDAWEKFKEDRSRDAVYRYLRPVFSVVVEALEKRQTKELLQVATKFRGVSYHQTADPFTTVIRCSCEKKLDAKTISKFARALRYAAHRKWPPRLLKSFIKELGGINAAADRYAKRLGRGR